MRILTSTLTFLFLIVFLSFQSSAQISILTNDMPNVGDTFRLSSALGGGGGGGGNQTDYLLTQTGADQVWDYTFLSSKSQTVDTFFSPLETPVSYNFVFTNLILYPDNFSDLAQRSNTIPTPPTGTGGSSMFSITDAYDFIQRNFDNQYAIVGNAFKLNDVPSPNAFNGKDIIYEFPLEYQDNFSSASNYEIHIPSFVDYYHRQVRTNEVDGWGKLYTPYGEWPQVLRVKSTIVGVDSIIFLQGPFPFPLTLPSTIIEYKWLAKNIGVPVLQITTRASSGFGGGGGQTTVSEVNYIDSMPPGNFQIDHTGIQTLDNQGYILYPNPAKNNLTLFSKSTSIGLVQIKDLQGRVVLESTGNQAETQFNITSLQAGMYTISFQNRVVKWIKEN
ncbi:MAG: T9SS type A sorting domain-containing protein [Bacteroidia bacterium]|nr:T9SS type A sorting domain-containing protein [Bacteroidia bacterium]